MRPIETNGRGSPSNKAMSSHPAKGCRAALRRLLVVSYLAASVFGALCAAQPGRNVDVAETREIKAGNAVLQIDFARGDLDLSRDAVLAHIRAAVSAVTTYYGRFPVMRARVLVIPAAGRHGDLQGTTWGDMGGWPGFTRIRIGEHMTAAELADDWTMTHELVHMAFPSLPDDQPLDGRGAGNVYRTGGARDDRRAEGRRHLARHGARYAQRRAAGCGRPGCGSYAYMGAHVLGGALFCLVADVEIRRETDNRKGLHDALRAVVAQDGTIDHEWDLPRALAIGDKATGTQVLSRMYASWKDKPVQVDLPKLWEELGIRSTPDGGVEFVAYGAAGEDARGNHFGWKLENEVQARDSTEAAESGQANSQRRAMRRATRKSTMPTPRRTDTCGPRAVTGRSRQKTLVKPSMAQALMVNMPAFCIVSGIK